MGQWLSTMHPIRLLGAALLLLIGAGVRIVEGQIVKPPESQPGWLEHWRLSTFSFGQIVLDQDKRKYFGVVGTGILITPDERLLYIVTAKHVFDDPSKKWHPKEILIRFAWQERSSVYDDLGTSISLFDSSGKAKWLSSEDGSDLAAIPISISELRSTRTPHAIHTQAIVTASNTFEGASVIVLGYPGIVGNEYLVRAISRGGVIAWLNPEDPYRKPFLIDAIFIQGTAAVRL